MAVVVTTEPRGFHVYQSNEIGRSLRSALLLGAATAAAITVAQPAAAQDQTVETVVVTGSRIPQQGLYSSSPVTAVGQQEIQLQGTTKVENLLNSLPSVLASNTSSDSNGASGTATVDLRGLGTNRTLVLVDGNRLMPGDPYTGSAADLNTIPTALVDHVEVLTGGASAVYGSDAIAGVVNFIMRKDFEGVEVDGSYSVYNAPNGDSLYDQVNQDRGYATAQKDYWGGGTTDLSLLIGTNSADGKGNITVYASYRNVQPVLQKNLDYSACALWSDFYSSFVCGGSSNYNRWRSFDNKRSPVGNGLPSPAPALPSDFFGGNPGGVLTPYAGQVYNYGPENYMLRNDTRYTGGYFAHYEVNKQFDVYSSMMFTDDDTSAQIAPSAIFSGSGPVQYRGTVNTHYYQINCDNPYMTLQQNTLLCGQTPGSAPTLPGGFYDGAGNITPGQSLLDLRIRNILGGPRIDNLRHTAYRMNIGVKGDLGNGWAYDIHGQYGLTLFTENYQNDLSGIRIENSLEVDPVTGKCFAAVPDSNGIINDPNCVPWDIFHGFSAPPSYVASPGFQQGYNEEQVISGQLTGDLGQWGVQSPWAKSPVAVAVGAEYRAEYIKLDTSYNYQIGDLTGQGTKILPIPRSGFSVSEAFGEIRIPVVQDMPLAEDLSLNAGFRYSSYSSVGSSTTYKVGAEWQPVDDLRFRASYSRASRAPNVLELYYPQKIGLFTGGGDPCAGNNGGAPVSAQCAAVWTAFGYDAASAAAALACPASQCNQYLGGNASLKPETADTLTLGVVLTPTFIDGFTATIDYFDIEVDDYVGTITPTTSLAGCYGSASPAAAIAYYCPFVTRSPATGSIYGAGYVADLNINLPYIKTSGMDFEATYAADLGDVSGGFLDGLGSLTTHFVGTWLQNYKIKPSSVALGTDTEYDCTGLYGPAVCGEPRPNWRHSMRFTWSTPWDVDFSLNWRHVGEVNVDVNQPNALLGGGSTLTTCPAGSSIAGTQVSTNFYGGNCGPGAHIDAQDYIDLAASWNVREGVQLRGGVNNVFAKRPPVVGSTFGSNGNTWPGTYDAMGRMFFVSATVKY